MNSGCGPRSASRAIPTFWENIGERTHRGDFRVQDGDEEYPRRELVALEDERDLERQHRRRAESLVRENAAAERDSRKRRATSTPKARAVLGDKRKRERDALRDRAAALYARNGSKSRTADLLGIGRERLAKVLRGE